MSEAQGGNLPEAVLDQAFAWAVRLHSGTANEADQQAFQQWLAQAQAHRRAWQKVQLVETEFSALRDQGPASHRTLRAVHKAQGLKPSSIVSCVALLLLITLFAYQRSMPWLADHRTKVGEQLVLQLPHGSQLWLASDSRIDIEETQQGPLIRLYGGEVMLDSSRAPMARKPRVETRFGHFTPIGTRFVVSNQGSASTLQVLEGQVQLKARQAVADQQVTAGQQWRVTASGVEPLMNNGLLPGAWVEGVIEAKDAPLAAVLDMLDRYRPGWLVYSPAVAQLRVTGVFRLQDTDSALAALAATLPIRIERTTDYWLRVTARQSGE